MRWTLAILAIGCGRIGFGERPNGMPDSSTDSPTDSSTNDAPPTDSTPAACLSNPAYVSFGGLTSRYRQVASNLSWAAAKADCEADGAYLTILDDQTEANASIVGDWVGMTDVATEGVWLTIFGDPAPFQVFRPGEPDGGTSDNCARLDDSTQQLEDRDCADLRDYTCECS